MNYTKTTALAALLTVGAFSQAQAELRFINYSNDTTDTNTQVTKAETNKGAIFRIHTPRNRETGQEVATALYFMPASFKGDDTKFLGHTVNPQKGKTQVGVGVEHKVTDNLNIGADIYGSRKPGLYAQYEGISVGPASSTNQYKRAGTLLAARAVLDAAVSERDASEINRAWQLLGNLRGLNPYMLAGQAWNSRKLLKERGGVFRFIADVTSLGMYSHLRRKQAVTEKPKIEESEARSLTDILEQHKSINDKLKDDLVTKGVYADVEASNLDQLR